MATQQANGKAARRFMIGEVFKGDDTPAAAVAVDPPEVRLIRLARLDHVKAIGKADDAAGREFETVQSAIAEVQRGGWRDAEEFMAGLPEGYPRPSVCWRGPSRARAGWRGPSRRKTECGRGPRAHAARRSSGPE